MKPLVLKATLLITFFLQASLCAQDKTLTGLVSGGVEIPWGFMAGYEHNVNGNSLGLGWSHIDLTASSVTVTGNSLSAAYTLYSKSIFNGWFVSPSMVYRNITTVAENIIVDGTPIPKTEIDFSIWEPHLNIGYAFLIAHRLQIRLHIGGGYAIFSDPTIKIGDILAITPSFKTESRFFPTLGITLGVSF